MGRGREGSRLGRGIVVWNKMMMMRGCGGVNVGMRVWECSMGIYLHTKIGHSDRH